MLESKGLSVMTSLSIQVYIRFKCHILCFVIDHSTGGTTQKTRSWYPEKLLYVDHLTLACKTLVGVRGRLEALGRSIGVRRVENEC